MNEASNIAQLESDLERNPGDQDTRVILADLYEGMGDPISETLRWMVENYRRPFGAIGEGFIWSRAWSAGCLDHFFRCLPNDVFELLKAKSSASESYKHFKSCKEATIELHKALSRCCHAK